MVRPRVLTPEFADSLQAEIQALAKLPVSFREFVSRAQPKYQWWRHCVVLAEALEKVAQGEITRLMVFMPPRHGKSEAISRLFPAYYLSQHPAHWVAVASYAFDLARTFSRAAREHYGQVVHDLSDDAKSVEMWETKSKGGLWAVGRGGAATGKGANVFIVDDPIKDAMEADSEIVRESLHEWYKSVVNTRLEPDGAVIVVNCMTGDTPILMADGTERPLSEVRRGDQIATYNDGRIEVSRVKDWRNQGSDCIFTIRTSSGIVVRANARHPLLIARGERVEWVQIKDLRIGDNTLRVIGESGGEFPALPKDVTNPRGAKGIVSTTTTRPGGRLAFAPHRAIQSLDETPTFATDTASGSQSSTLCLSPRMDAAPYATNFRELTCVPTGAESCVWITTPPPEGCADCSATTAISPSDTVRQNPLCSVERDTYAIIPDPIVEISDAGVEEVFDIEIEGTSNFIANGLVSHNTRWHEDDLSGHLLEIEATSPEPERWTIINFPAIAEPEDERPQYPTTCTVLRDWRQAGEALCPERYPLERLRAIHATSGQRVWTSLYQQRPSEAGGTVFLRKWWKFYKKADQPKTFDRMALSWDLSFKNTDGSDFVAGQCWGQVGGKFYLLDRLRERLSFTETCRAIQAMRQRWPAAHAIYVEDKANGPAVIDALTRTVFGIVAVNPEGGKVARAYAQQPLVEAGQVYLPHPDECGWVEAFIREHGSFPNGRHDDEVDAFTQAMAKLAWVGRQRVGTTPWIDPDRHPGFDPETHRRIRGRRDPWDDHTGPNGMPHIPRLPLRGSW